MKVLEGLSFLHNDARIIHRNLTPENIVLNRSGCWKLFGFEHCFSLKSEANVSMFAPLIVVNIFLSFTTVRIVSLTISRCCALDGSGGRLRGGRVGAADATFAAHTVLPGARRVPDARHSVRHPIRLLLWLQVRLQPFFHVTFTIWPRASWFLPASMAHAMCSIHVQRTVHSIQTKCTLPRRWSPASDMFSLGLVVLTVFGNGRLPFADCQTEFSLYKKNIDAVCRAFGVALRHQLSLLSLITW